MHRKADLISLRCQKLGPPFFKWDKMGQVWRFAHVQEGSTEKLTKAWQVKQDLDKEACGSGNKQIVGSGNKQAGSKRAANEDKGKAKKAKVVKDEPAEEVEVDKKDISKADRDIASLIASYRNSLSTYESVMEAARQSPDWAWLGPDNKLMIDLRAKGDAVKTSAPHLLRTLLITNDIAAAKKAKGGKAEWVTAVTSMVTSLEPLISALGLQCKKITDMHARFVCE